MRSFHASQHPPRGHGRTETHCPEFQRDLHLGNASARSGRNSLPGISSRHRGLPSVHEYVAATRHTLPDFSPRFAFGCRFGAAGQKLIARNFNAAFHRCMSMSRLPVIRCPIFHRDLPSVAASARSGRNSLPGISTCACFGA